MRRRDLGLLFSHVPAVAAGRFTRSKVRAASVERSSQLLPASGIRAIVVASGNANAMNGPQAAADDLAVAQAVAAELDISEGSVLTAATGVIGAPFPVAKIVASVERLTQALVPDATGFAEAILTTDTTTKRAERRVYLGGRRVAIVGVAKGSGMVHPNMATVLGFIASDAAISPELLDRALGEAVDASFNMLSIDRDTSTNDAVIALANGLSGAPQISEEGESYETFRDALVSVMVELARAIGRDGEGARRLVSVHVQGAETLAAARELARATVGSNLVKAALFGEDPSFGRIGAALGARAAELGLALHPASLSISLQGVALLENGVPLPTHADSVRGRLRDDEIKIEISVGDGPGAATAWGCDLTYDYVRINADYAAVLVEPEGQVRRDRRLETKTPDLKTDVLVSALRYIERFTGTRAVIRFGKTTLEKRNLAALLAEDVRLLSAVGLCPILVQSGVSELVVSMLSRAGVRAVGLSGADGQLLRLGNEPHAFSIDPDVVETLIQKGYVPVVVPEITEELEAAGEAAPDVDAVAAELAIVCGAKKLIYLDDTPGILVEGLLASEISADELARRLANGQLAPEHAGRARAAVRALSGGVDTVHMIDERIPHNVVAELFTDSGVGTMVR